MTRSLKKGPYIYKKLEDKVLAMNESGKKVVVKTWARASMISPDFVGHTIAVHNGNKFIPVYITEKAEKIKEAKKTQYFAKLNDVPSSPRKMRLVADMIRGMEVNRALGTLRYSNKAASKDVEKVLRSAIANWEQKNERKAEAGELFITKVYVDEGVTLKRLRPAPQGRGYRIRKRSNHISLFVDTKVAATNTNDNQE